MFSNDRILRNLSTNLFGALSLTRALLPHFRARDTGTIVFIGSLLGFVAEPTSTAYAISKYAMEGVADCLRAELALVAPNVRTTIFEPGAFRTAQLSSNNLKWDHSQRPEAYARLGEKIKGMLDWSSGRQPGSVEKGVEVMIDVVKGVGVAADVMAKSMQRHKNAEGKVEREVEKASEQDATRPPNCSTATKSDSSGGAIDFLLNGESSKQTNGRALEQGHPGSSKTEDHFSMRYLPPRLPLGSDAVEGIRKKCLETLALCDEWEEVVSNTNVTEDPSTV